MSCEASLLLLRACECRLDNNHGGAFLSCSCAPVHYFITHKATVPFTMVDFVDAVEVKAVAAGRKWRQRIRRRRWKRPCPLKSDSSGAGSGVKVDLAVEACALLTVVVVKAASLVVKM